MRNVFALALALLLCGTALAQEAPDTQGGEAPAADVVAPAPEVAAPAAPTVVVAPAPEVAAPAAPTVVVDGVPQTDAEVGTIIEQLLDAAKNGHWTVFGGLLLLLLIWGMNRMGLAAKIGSKYVPWVSLGTGAVIAIAVGLGQGAPLVDSLKLGLLEGGLAIALWELVAKHFMGSKPSTPETPPVA